MSLAGR